MSELLLPPSVIAQKEAEEKATHDIHVMEAMEQAKQQYQIALARAYRAGYDLAATTPRRMQAGLNVQANFWRWYREEVEGE